MIRARALPALVAATALALVACDGSTETPPTDDPAAPEDPADEPDPPADDDPPAEPDVLTDAEGREFSYLPVGELLPNSGPGYVDDTDYRPHIVFPLPDGAFLNSQVYRAGGMYQDVNGFSGGQCDGGNYDYPWQDTFCEARSRNQAICPGGGHEGLDVRPATCIPQTSGTHTAVAVEDGRITTVYRHWVTLMADDGTAYNYLHLKMDELDVVEGQTVAQGDPIGKVWNDFYSSDGTRTATTYHLHFEMYQNYAVEEDGASEYMKVNPYITMVSAYERMLRDE